MEKQGLEVKQFLEQHHKDQSNTAPPLISDKDVEIMELESDDGSEFVAISEVVVKEEDDITISVKMTID